MSTVFIDNKAIQLNQRFFAGTTIDEVAAYVLNDIQLKRIKAKLRYALQKGDVNPDGLQELALALAQQDLVPYLILDDDDEDNDPIFAEAMNIARELIIGRMAQEGLPPPKGINDHAKALVDARPDLVEIARKRVEAKYRAASQAIEETV